MASNADAITKDALCDAELGAAFNTASWLDITALYQAVIYTNHRFTISNASVPGAIYVDTSSGGYSFIGSPGVVQTVPVACGLR